MTKSELQKRRRKCADIIWQAYDVSKHSKDSFHFGGFTVPISDKLIRQLVKHGISRRQMENYGFVTPDRRHLKIITVINLKTPELSYSI